MNTVFSESGWDHDVKGYVQGEVRSLAKLMKITEDFRKCAGERGRTDGEAVQPGMQEKRHEPLEQLC